MRAGGGFMGFQWSGDDGAGDAVMAKLRQAEMACIDARADAGELGGTAAGRCDDYAELVRRLEAAEAWVRGSLRLGEPLPPPGD